MRFHCIIFIFFYNCFFCFAQLSILQKHNLKVLDIGNSYSRDATSMLEQLVLANGADLSDMCIYMANRSGGSYKMWYDIYYNKDGSSVYTIKKLIGGISASCPVGWGQGNDGSLFRSCLSDEQWDIIIIHQMSTYAPYYEQWKGTSAGGYFNELLQLLQEKQPNAIIGLMLPHSLWSKHERNAEHSALERWKLMAESTQRCCEENDIHFVIPYGTAVQNIRNTSWNDEYDLTRDGSHCGYGLCQYVASCCFYESLIAPRTGITILGNTYRYDASGKLGGISVIDDNAILAQEAAIMAVKKPFEISDLPTNIQRPKIKTIQRQKVYSISGIELPMASRGKRVIFIDGNRNKILIK